MGLFVRLKPQASVAVKVTVAAPVAPQSSLNASKSLLQVTPLQASEALAPPLLASHASRSAALPAPSHSTVASAAAMSMVGAVVSSIVNVAGVLLLEPRASVAVKVTSSHARRTAIVAQGGEVVAPGYVAARIGSARRRCWRAIRRGRLRCRRRRTQPSHPWRPSMAGAVVSSIVNVAVVLLLLPQSSVAVKVTVAMPVAPQSSLKARSRCSRLRRCMHRKRQHRRCWRAIRQVSCVAGAVLNRRIHGSHVDGWAVVSSIVNVAVVLLLLPQSSVAVKVTVAMPVAPQSSLKARSRCSRSRRCTHRKRQHRRCWRAIRQGQLRCRLRHTQPSHPWQPRWLEPWCLRS